MAEQHVKLFQGLGIPQDVIDQVEGVDAEAAKTWTPPAELNTAVRAALKGTLKDDFLNDADFLNSIPEDKVPEGVKKKIESGQYGRFMAEIMEVAKKQLGLEDTDLADMTEEEKKSLKKSVAKIAEKHLAKKGSVEGARDLQKQVSKLTEDLEAKDTQWQEKLDAKLKEVNGTANTKLIKALTRAELVALDGVQIAVNPAYITDPVLAKLTAQYTVTLDEGDNLVLKSKADPNLDPMEGGKKVTFRDALKAIVLAEKLGTAKDGGDGGEGGGGSRKKTIMVGGEGTPGSFELPANIADKVKANQELEGK